MLCHVCKERTNNVRYEKVLLSILQPLKLIPLVPKTVFYIPDPTSSLNACVFLIMMCLAPVYP